MNESPLRFDDLALFLLVAQSASLTDAARRANTPLPTLSRRMAALERQSGRALFLRGKAGYALTADGQALAREVSGLHDIARRLTRWQDAAQGPVPVRITAGFWTSRHLARHLRRPDPGLWHPAFVPSNAALDLARREADIGIRNAPPDHPWLARQKLRRIRHAIYAASDAITGFVSLPRDADLPRSQRWLQDSHGDEITCTATDPRLCLDLALGGFGATVLPCFIGDAEPELVRRSDPIPALDHDEWLVSHHEARNDPPIRAALTAIANALHD